MYHKFSQITYLMGRNKSESLVIPVTSFQCEPCLVSPSDRCSFGRVCEVDVNFCPRYENHVAQSNKDTSSTFSPFCEFYYSKISFLEGVKKWVNMIPLSTNYLALKKLVDVSLQQIHLFSKLSALLSLNGTGSLCGFSTPPLLCSSGSLCHALLNFGLLDLVVFAKKAASKIALLGDARGCFFSRSQTGGLVIPPFCSIIGIFAVSFGRVL